jgi:hypothetical protein
MTRHAVSSDDRPAPANVRLPHGSLVSIDAIAVMPSA